MSDPYYSSVSLLLQANGTNGSTTFVDTGPGARTITTVSDAQITTTGPKWGAGCYTSTTGKVSLAADAAFNFSGNDFTIEGWGFTANESVTMTLYGGYDSGLGGNFGPQVTIQGGVLLGVAYDSSGSFGGINGSSSIPHNTWFHWAYVRSGSNFELFLDGVSQGTNTSARNCGTSGTTYVGYRGFGSVWNGKIDDVRITNGVARYVAGNFTPPTAEFDASSGTTVGLTGVSATGSAGFVFGKAAALSAVTGTASVGTVKAAAAAALTSVTGTGSAGNIQAPKSLTAVNAAGTAGTPAAALTVGLTGVSATASVGTVQIPNNAVGAQTVDGFDTFGYLDGGFLPADSYFASVVLLLHADLSSGATHFPDNSNSHKNVLVVGNPVASNTSPAFGTGSIVMGSGSLSAVDASDFNFGTNDFTVEGWAKTSVPSTSQYLFSGVVAGTTNTAAGPSVAVLSGQLTGEVRDSGGGSLGFIQAGTVPANTWFHWAYTRVGTSFRLFLNGTQVGSTVTSSTAAGPAGRGIVGNSVYGVFGQPWQGFIDEVRITNGTGRYTSNFTAPSAVFPDTGSLATRNAAAAQTIPAFAQAATVYGAGSRSLAAAQTMDPFTQAYWVSAPSRILASSTTFVFGQVATVISTADRNLITYGDSYYDSVAYLIHCDTSTSSGGFNFEPDTGPNAFTVPASLYAAVATDAGAIGGKCIAFANAAGSALWQTAYRVVSDRTISTTEMRVRFDTLNATVAGTPVPGSPGSYTFDPTLQQTGWFYSSGDGGGALRIGLAGAGGAYQADWTTISAGGSSITFAPYVLQIKGYVLVGSASYNINAHGSIAVTTGWHNVTVVRSAAAVSFYLDGVFDFSITLPDPAALFLDETFVAGADTTRGFAYQPGHVNLSAIDEMRHTWGVARYLAPYTPATVAFADAANGKMAAITQSATITHAAPSISGAQTIPAFVQVATCSGAGQRSAAAAQTVPTIAQSAQVWSSGQRHLGATQQMDSFAQVATSAPTRTIYPLIAAIDLITQVATVTTIRTAAAAQNLAIAQTATAVHTPDTETGSTTFVFGQVATAQALLKLSTGQIMLPFGQATTVKPVATLQGAELLAPFVNTTVVEGAFISNSIRGYRVRPEARTFAVNLT